MISVRDHRSSLALLPLALLALLVFVGCEADDDEVVVSDVQLEVTEIEDDGFAQPAGVVVDPDADVYLVSHMNGNPGERDGNGFISRISPNGEIMDLRWIDLTGTALALNSPRGMAIRGDSLFVADIDCVRIFDRASGTDDGYTCLDDVSFITDLDAGPEGSIFATDSGLEFRDGTLQPTGNDAVYRLVMTEGRRGATLGFGEEMGNPRGIAVGTRGIFVTTSGTGELYALTPDGAKTSIFPASERELDGIVFLPDGSFVFSSPSEGSLTMVDAAGQVTDLASGIPDPQGLAYDVARHRLIVTSPGANRIFFLDLP
jgi:sugar lactone lactonase YvrE